MYSTALSEGAYSLTQVFAPPSSTRVLVLVLLSMVPLTSSPILYYWWRQIGSVWSSMEDVDVCFSFCCLGLVGLHLWCLLGCWFMVAKACFDGGEGTKRLGIEQKIY
ncbi:hypothetical protein DVH24_034751 [Malus domestica]|uniref:Uncharacterized protein n=1 Tax=Malus domestica TaxID=3750 RepID=A0A498J325_MALDO|nr:hypothetical protein DVH24_034751 [Malus domestica]